MLSEKIIQRPKFKNHFFFRRFSREPPLKIEFELKQISINYFLFQNLNYKDQPFVKFMNAFFEVSVINVDSFKKPAPSGAGQSSDS